VRPLFLVKTSDYEEHIIDFDHSSFKRTQEKNTASTISFTITRTDRNAFVYDLLQSDQVSVIFDGQEYVVQQIAPKQNGSVTSCDITAVHVLASTQDIQKYNVLDEEYADDSKPQHTIEDLLHFIFDGNEFGYTWEVKGTFSKVTPQSFGNNDGLSLIKTIIDLFNCVVKADNKHLIFYDDSSWKNITQKQFRYLYNTDEVQLSLDKTNVKTKVMCYGAKDEHDNYLFDPYVYTSPNVSRFGVKYAPAITNDQITTKADMDKYAAEQLQDVPEVTFTLKYNGTDVPNIGDVWMLIHEPMGFNTDVTIIGVTTYDFDDTKLPELTFSNAKKDIISLQQQVAKKASNADKTLKNAKQFVSENLPSDVRNASQAISAVQNQVKFTNSGLITGKANTSQTTTMSVMAEMNSIDDSESETVKFGEGALYFSPDGVNWIEVVNEKGVNLSEGYGALPQSVVDQLQIPNYEEATETTSGLMSAADKRKLDLIIVDQNGNVVVNIPLASSTENGLMTKEDFAKLSRILFSGSGTIDLQNVLNTLQDHENRIAALEGGGA
jgi:hypothetical protein